MQFHPLAGPNTPRRLRPALDRWAFFVALTAFAPTGFAEEWLEFGGPNGDFVVEGSAIEAWGDGGPAEIWRASGGTGYSALAVNDDAVIAFFRPPVADGQSRSEAPETVVFLDASSGVERWRHEYMAPMREGHLEQFGIGPHATPMLLDDVVITLGYTGELRALSLESGELVWRTNLVDEHGGEVTRWGFSASPRRWNSDVVVPVGGEKAGLIAFDPKDGSVRWNSPATTVSYATPVIVEALGVEQIVYFAADGLHAIQPGTGEMLWSTKIENGWANHASMPVFVPPDRFWVVSQQEAAARMLRLSQEADVWSVETEWTNGRVRAHFWNSLVIGDEALVASGDSVQVLSGVDLSSGEVRWRNRAVGKANLLRLGNQVLSLDEDGVLTLLRRTDEGLQVEAQSEVLGSPSWTAPVLVGERLYLRDESQIVALELKRSATGASSAGQQP